MSEDPQSPLQQNLAKMSTFLVGEQSVAETLTRVVQLAAASIPPAAFAGVTMLVDGRVSTQAFTDPSCPEIDQAQYVSGHGPCLESFRRAEPVVVEALATDARWPEFASAALAHGVRSTMSLPMLAGDHAVGALNFYAPADAAFGSLEVEAGRVFASQAAVVVSNAQAYWGARLMSEHLQLALDRRQPIDLAKGIIMNSMGCGPDEAFDVLVRQSQRENRKLHDVAADIVERSQRRRS